ncbi:MAG: nuclear transport factor 2 family protein [Nocardioides sp.]|nr:nuclear transport factor 2 family protein [Nocardioides sp.]
MTESFAATAAGFYTALNQVLAGEVGPMLDLWSHEDDVSYMSPFGELLRGWEPIQASWVAQADARLGGEVHAEDLHVVEGDVLAFAVGFERGEVQVDGRPTPVDIRATSLYRREAGRWLMVGHHTDPLG